MTTTRQIGWRKQWWRALSFAMLLVLPIPLAIGQWAAGHSCSANARLFFRQQQYTVAQKQLQDCLRADPQDPTATELLGLVMAIQGDHIQADTYLHQAVKLVPANNEYRFNLAVFLAKNEQIEAADLVIQPLLSSSDDPDVDSLIGYIRLREHQEQEAVAWFQKALAHAPNSVEALYRLGFSYHSLGEFSQAISCYRRVLQLDPSHFYARLQLGKVLLAEGDYAEAEQELKKSTLIRPAYSSTWRYLSEAQLFTNQLRAALDSARTAIEYGPLDSRNQYQLGTVLNRLGETQAADAALKTMEQMRARQRESGSPSDPLEY